MYADSELQDDELRELNHHLEQCASCRQVLEEQKSVDWLLKNKPEPQISDQYLDSFWDQLFEKIDQQQAFPDPELQGEEYPLLERLGASTTGELFLTRTTGDEDTPHPLVLKRLSAQYAEDSEYLLAFIRGAQLTSQLKHENICPVVKAGTDSKGSYLVRGYIAGMDLQALIQRHALQRRLIPQPVTLHIISAISNALEHAHQDVVHGGLTPSDVLLGFQGDIGLINFGMGKYWAQQIQTGNEVSRERARFLTPEHLTSGVIDPRTDVFTLALIMYELLTGKEVFPEGLTKQTLAQLTQGSIPPPSSVRPSLSSTLDTMVMKGLELDPAERYESVREIREEIESIIADDTGSGMDLASLMARTFANEAHIEEERLALVCSGAVPDLAPPPATPPVESLPVAPATAPPAPAPAPQAVSPNVIPPEEPPRSSRRWMGIAAALLLVVTGGAVFALMQSRERPAAEVAMAVQVGATADNIGGSTESRTAASPKLDPVVRTEEPVPTADTSPEMAEDRGDVDTAAEPVVAKPKAKARTSKSRRSRRRYRRRPKRRSRPRSRSRVSKTPKPRPASPAMAKPEPAPAPVKSAAFGYLKVISATTVDVVVDGWKATTINGKLNMKLTPGPHQLQVVFKLTGQSFKRTVRIKPGKTKILRLVRGQ